MARVYILLADVAIPSHTHTHACGHAVALTLHLHCALRAISGAGMFDQVVGGNGDGAAQAAADFLSPSRI
jgi:hypothetical protein